MLRLTSVSRHFVPAGKPNLLLASRAMSSTAQADVLIENKGSIGKLVTLNRPKALNALNMNMVNIMKPFYQQLHEQNQQAVVVMKGAGGKAFCAGGDIRAIYDAKKANQPLENLTEFFRGEYVLDQMIATLPASVPHVALLNGITMGGGVGLSVHGRYRVASDLTTFAMPETAIGFFCDVGGSYFLPRLPSHVGMWLALTGSRLKGADVYHAGIATHYISAEQMPALEERLLGLANSAEVDAILNSLANGKQAPEGTLASQMEAIERCFSKNSVEEIIEALQKENTEWANKNLALLNKMSPTSLKVVHRQLREGEKRNMKECFAMEENMADEFMRKDDFFEGVRAVLVDKDQSPKWNPSTLQEVTSEAVARYFPKL